jgi:Protein of unknown function (DUF1488)
LERLEIYKRKP